MINIYNSLTGKKEEFKPLEDMKVKMYACGITVSKPAHIGHAYQAIVFDMIVKYFTYCCYDVFYVRNYTDVDDKIIEMANTLGENPITYAQNLIKKTDDEMEHIGVKYPNIFAKVTDHIPDIISFIEKLIEKGFAYITDDGDVYYEVSKFPAYGKLSNNTIDNTLDGVRKKNEDNKRSANDFALWKKAKEGEIFWDSPWGKGRPGWHIECSTMSIKYLGETFDIHGGGRDLKFPHHENEIAQSEAMTGKKFANYWVHNGLVKINGEKMSKSLNNTILLSDLIKEFDTEVIRMALLNNIYSSDINVTDDLFTTIEKQLYGFYKTLNITNTFKGDLTKTNELLAKLKSDFENSMNDNFNTACAISLLFPLFNTINENINNYDLLVVLEELKKLYYPLGIFQTKPVDFINKMKNKYLNNITVEEINNAIAKRMEAKQNKDYLLADSIRHNLELKGIILEDRRDGTIWDINI